MTDINADELRVRLGIYEAISAAMERWSEVSSVASSAETREDVAVRLAALLGIGDEQADAVMSINVSSLSRQRRERIRTEIGLLRSDLAALEPDPFE